MGAAAVFGIGFAVYEVAGRPARPASVRPPETVVVAAHAPRRRAAPAPRIARGQTDLQRLLALGLPIHCGGHHGRYVALTLDDGPGLYTSLALRILSQAHARATFFLVGKELRYWPTLPRRELTLAALGDHTWTHPVLPRLGRAGVFRELATTQTEIRRLTGDRIHLFRPPYGLTDSRVEAVAQSLGMVEVLWSIDSGDSRGAGWRRIARNVAAGIRPGSIVLLHENRGQTLRALRFAILPLLRARRLTPVSLDQLFALDPPASAQVRHGLAGC